MRAQHEAQQHCLQSSSLHGAHHPCMPEQLSSRCIAACQHCKRHSVQPLTYSWWGSAPPVTNRRKFLVCAPAAAPAAAAANVLVSLIWVASHCVRSWTATQPRTGHLMCWTCSRHAESAGTHYCFGHTVMCTQPTTMLATYIDTHIMHCVGPA
jgi:hypothetical protein